MVSLMKIWSLFKREFPRILMTWRVARVQNFNFEIIEVNNGIPIDFRLIKCIFVDNDKQYHGNIS